METAPKFAAIREEMRHIGRIASPLFIAQMAQMGTGVVDTMMAGRYGDQTLAAIAIGYHVWLPIYILVLGVLFAGSIIVAQDFGAQRRDKIRDQLPQALWVAVFLGFTTSPLAWFCGPAMELMGMADDTQAVAIDYTQMVALGLPAAALFQALRFHAQGVGATKPFAIAAAWGFFLNIPLNYAFIYGRFGMPEMGAEGCGVATAISMWFSLGLIARSLGRDKTVQDYLPDLRFVAPRAVPIREILTLGLPIGLAFFLEVGVFSAIALLVAGLGDTAMASHQIAFNIWDMFYIPMIAIGTAISTRMGHAIGAGQREGVFLALWTGSLIGALIALGTTLVLLAVPELIIALYTDSKEIREMATRLIGLAAFFIVIDGIQIVGSFALRAYKETRFPFVVMVISYWLIALPLGWWLGLEVANNASDGAAGFWYGTIAGITLCAVMISLRVWFLLKRPLPPPSEFESTNPSGMPDERPQV